MISFWEREHFTKFNFIVVGGGIVGCSTAYHLAKRYPKASIALLERGVFPSGASTKNAGFACFGSLTELADDLPKLGEENLLALVEKRWLGLQKLRSTLGDQTIDYQNNGGYELIRQKEIPALDRIDYFNQLLKNIFAENVFKENRNLVNQFGFSSDKINSVVSNQYEGQINTGKMMKAWWEICAQQGIKIFTGCQVTKIEEQQMVEVEVVDAADGKPLYFKAEKVAICTNAFSKQFLPNETINPGRGMVMITDPIDKLKPKGVFHYDEGFFYFRNVGSRLLIGGGRNLDMETESTLEPGINPKIKQRILDDITELILPRQSFSIDMEWSGIMAFGKNKSPLVKKVTDKIVVGARLGGMGVAIGTQIGEEIQRLLND
ncbi:FAD-dependent oxidoreductase [Marivirga lumbricoides]|uniref:FAD-dependent oxidoreductase n=1 Tax=Marivirga lumbricoides TaxID=1046115 RepID=A0A2T4DTQ4_9BACT|nr:FAD-dependent oxidoreductase [Marivirga lumbricoides]